MCPDVCDHWCVPTEFSSFYCICEDGYRLRNDPYSCPFDDVFCRDTANGYMCFCRSDGNKPINGTFCEPINQCDDHNGGCEHYCYNEVGGYRCGCEEGYHVGRDKHLCLDVNECHSIDESPCGDMDCINTVGSYYCLGRAIDPVQQPGHSQHLIGGAEMMAASGATTGMIVGATVSTAVLTVLLTMGLALGYRWVEKRRKAQAEQ